MGVDESPPQIPAGWLAEFEAMARRPIETRFRYAIIKTDKPVLDDASYRSEENLPDWLGDGRV